MRKLLDAADGKLNCDAESSKIQQAVYQLLSSSNMRKMFDAAEAPTKRKKTKVEEDDRDKFRDVYRKVIELDQTKVVYQTRELGKTEDGSAMVLFHDTEDFLKQDGTVTPSRSVTPSDSRSMHSSSRGKRPEVVMKIDDVVKAVGHMSAFERGFGSHKQQTDQTKQHVSKVKVGSVRKRLSEGVSVPSEGEPVSERLSRIAAREKTNAEFGWATAAIKKGLEGNMKLLQLKGKQLVQSFTTRLMADVNEGHSVMLHISGHWLLIAKIQDEIACFNPKKN